MNWHAVIKHFQHEAEAAYKEAKASVDPADGRDDIAFQHPSAIQVAIIQGSIAAAKGDILRAIAKALNEGIKP